MENLRVHDSTYANYFEGTLKDYTEAGYWRDDSCHHNQNMHSRTEAGRGNALPLIDWYGVESMDEFRKVVTDWVYPPAMERLQDTQKPPVLTGLRRKLAYSTLGDELDRNRLYSGNPEFFRVTKRQAVRTRPPLTLQVNMAQSWRVPAREIMWRGVAALSFARMASSGGFPIQIVATCGFREVYINGLMGSRDAALLFYAKRFNQPLSLPALSSVIAFAGTLRYTALQALRASPNVLDLGMGFPFDVNLGQRFANILRIDRNVRCKESCNKWLAEVHKTLLDISKES